VRGVIENEIINLNGEMFQAGLLFAIYLNLEETIKMRGERMRKNGVVRLWHQAFGAYESQLKIHVHTKAAIRGEVSNTERIK
jgi:hypothetical protein